MDLDMDEELWSEARKICRICLRIDPRSFDIFNSYYVERHTLYCDMLAYCTKFKLHPKDGLPPYMCRNCIEHLEDMYEFHLECEESEKNFLWLLSELSRRLIDSLRDRRAGSFFAQRISIAIQRGNAASLLGMFPDDSDVEEYFDA